MLVYIHSRTCFYYYIYYVQIHKVICVSATHTGLHRFILVSSTEDSCVVVFGEQILSGEVVEDAACV